MNKVLLVDDEDIEREAMAEIIPWKKLDMELVDMAWNGIEGLEKIRMHIPDIVITDIKMPVMNGLEWTARSVDDEKTFEPGMIVMVKEIKGVTLYVTESSDMPQMNGDQEK